MGCIKFSKLATSRLHWRGRGRGFSPAIGIITASRSDDDGQTIWVARRQPHHVVAIITPGWVMDNSRNTLSIRKALRLCEDEAIFLVYRERNKLLKHRLHRSREWICTWPRNQQGEGEGERWGRRWTCARVLHRCSTSTRLRFWGRCRWRV